MTTACLGDGVCTNPQCPRHGIAWGVTEDLVETVSELMVPKHSGPAWDSHSAATKRLLIENYEPTARAVLAAVVPEVQDTVRRQVAEEIAAANEHAADELDMPFMDGYGEHQDWFKDQLHAQAAKAREMGGGDQ